MITIYNAPGSRSLRVIWMCEEMGLPYEAKTDSIFRPSLEFRKLHPGKTFPAMLDDGLLLTESIAILQYLADRYGPTPLALTGRDGGYPQYLEFLQFGESSLSAFLTPLVPTKFMAPDDQKENFTAGVLKQSFLGRLQRIEARLAEAPWLAGEAFTAADISVGYALTMAGMLGVGPFPERVADYEARLRARPAFQRANAVGRDPKPA